MLIETPKQGSVLLIGPDQSWQSHLARHIAAKVLHKKGSVGWLVNTPGEENEARNAMRDLLVGDDRNPDLARFYTLSNVRQYLTGEALGKALAVKKVFQHKPAIVVIDWARTMHSLFPGMALVRVATELAKAARCTVYLTTSYGPAQHKPLNLSAYVTDHIWHCTALPNLGLQLENAKPIAGSTMKFAGKVGHGGQIVFEREEREFAS